MNMNKLIAIAGVGALAYIIWRQFQQPQQGEYAVSPLSYPSQNYNLGLQPAELYPYSAINPPRVDNSSEPWYGGSRTFNQTADAKISGLDMNFAQNVQYIKGAADISTSLQDIWGSIGSFFDTEDLSVSVSDFSSSFDWNSMESSNPSWYNA